MILVGDAHTGQPPRVFESGIERDAVGLERQRGAVGREQHGAWELLGESARKAFAPFRRSRRQPLQREADWIFPEPRIDAAPAVESPPRIGFVEIEHHPRVLHAFELVERVLELRVHAEVRVASARSMKYTTPAS